MGCQNSTATPPPAEASTKEGASADAEADAADVEEKRKLQSFIAKKRENIIGVSATEDEIKNYKPPSYPKSDASKAKIAETLQNNDKMKTLGLNKIPAGNLEELVMACEERKPTQNEDVIKQGDEGNTMYIIESGTFDIFVARKNDDGSLGNPAKVAQFTPGMLFGELAILYDAPRAATVRCASADALVWALDRTTFQMLLKKSGVEKVEQYSGWLTEIDLLKALNLHEISLLADACESTLYEPDEVIIKQGDMGDAFFILEEGTCAAFVEVNGQSKNVLAYTKQGEYFGELALLNEAPRKATIKATADASVLKMDKESFYGLLGPVIDRLRTEADKYPKYDNQI